MRKAFLLLLLNQFLSRICVDGQYGFDNYVDDYYDANPGPSPSFPYPYPFGACLPNITCSPSNSTNNSSSAPVSGNNLFLILDPFTNSFTIKVAPPYNLSQSVPASPYPYIPTAPICPLPPDINTINPNPPVADGTVANIITINGTNPNEPNGGGTEACSLISLLSQLKHAIHNQVTDHLTNSLSDIHERVKHLRDSEPGPLLNDIEASLNGRLNETLLETWNEVGKTINSKLGRSIVPSNAIEGLLKNITQHLGGGAVAGVVPNPLSSVSDKVESAVNESINILFSHVTTLLKELLDPTSLQEALPNLAKNITSDLKETLSKVLDDEDTLLTNLLNELVANSSAKGNLTRNLEVLLTDALNNTICNDEKLLNNTESFSALVEGVNKLLDELLQNTLHHVRKSVDDKFNDVLRDDGLQNNLMKNCGQKLTDSVTALLRQKAQAIRDNPMLDSNFKQKWLANLTNSLTKSLSGVPTESTVPGIPGLPAIPGMSAYSGLVPSISSPISNLMDQQLDGLGQVQSLLNGTSMPNTLVQAMHNKLEKLLPDILDSLLQSVKNKLHDHEGNLTGVQNIKSPLDTTISKILKDVHKCSSLTCGNTNSRNNPGNITNLSTTTSTTTNPPCTSTPTAPLRPQPCNVDVNTFHAFLQNYQNSLDNTIDNSLTPWNGPAEKSISSISSPSSIDPCALASEDQDFSSLTDKLLKGISNTLRLTDDLASNQLLQLIDCTQQTANSSSSPAIIPLPVPIAR